MTETMDLCLPPSKEAKQNKTKQKCCGIYSLK